MVKVIFIGGLTNGKIVYDYLKRNKYTDLALAITYTDDSHASNHVIFADEEGLIKDISANKYVEAIKKVNADFIFVAGWSELLSDDILKSAQKGVIGFHPSKLPMDRGRSVLAWQIAEGYTETALSMFFYNDLPDCGDIIAQERITIDFEDVIQDILNKVDNATYNLMKAYYPLIRCGNIIRKPQRIEDGTFRRLRTNKDSTINWNWNSKDIYNLIRAISKPYPGAIGILNNKIYRIWNAKIVSELNFISLVQPGEIVCFLYDNSLIVKTRDSFIHLTDYEVINDE